MRVKSIIIAFIACLCIIAEVSAQTSDSLIVNQLEEEGVKFSHNNSVTLLMSGQEKFDDMFQAIRQARSSVHLEYFNFRNDSIASLLFDILAERGMLVLHSSYVLRAEGDAILFSGASGIGKSTQAELWREFAAARVINGDRSLVDVDRGIAHGIFYSGTSGICENHSAPIRAIVLPEQRAENRVFVPAHREAFMRLLNQCSYYPWDAESAALMTELVARLVGRVPIYRLDCRKDEGAVRALENELRRE